MTQDAVTVPKMRSNTIRLQSSGYLLDEAKEARLAAIKKVLQISNGTTSAFNPSVVAGLLKGASSEDAAKIQKIIDDQSAIRATDLVRAGLGNAGGGPSSDAYTVQIRAIQAAITASADEHSQLASDLESLGKSLFYIEFNVTPDINESGSASYGETPEIRSAASILIYTGSPSRTFAINAKFVSRTPYEAAVTEIYLNVLRSWRMPEALTGGAALGIPSIINLIGYNNMYKGIPVVLTNLSIDLSSEFDYILAAGTSTPIPIITSVSITLKENRNQDGEISGLDSFDIAAFRDGRLEQW